MPRINPQNELHPFLMTAFISSWWLLHIPNGYPYLLISRCYNWVLNQLQNAAVLAKSAEVVLRMAMHFFDILQNTDLVLNCTYITQLNYDMILIEKNRIPCIHK